METCYPEVEVDAAGKKLMSDKALIAVVDDDSVVREVITDMIAAINIEIETFSSAEDFLSGDPSRFDCLVLDVRMTGMSGMQLHAMLAKEDYYLPTIIVTGHGDVPMAVKAVSTGAIDFIEKPFKEQQLWDSISEALAVGKQRRTWQDERQHVSKKLGLLSDKELDVLRLLIQGKTDKQASHELDISRRTAAFHRSNIFAKTGISSTTEIAALVARHDIDV
jgi:two-component system response regulator DctR